MAAVALINAVGNPGGFIGPTIISCLAASTGTLSEGQIAIGRCLIHHCGMLAARARKKPGRAPGRENMA